MPTTIDLFAGLVGWVTVWLCLQLPLGIILSRYISSADVIAKSPLSSPLCSLPVIGGRRIAMARNKAWIGLRCCDWGMFLCSVMAAAERLKFPILLINRCEARSHWRRYGCTRAEVVRMQRSREINSAIYLYSSPRRSK